MTAPRTASCTAETKSMLRSLLWEQLALVSTMVVLPPAIVAASTAGHPGLMAALLPLTLAASAGLLATVGLDVLRELRSA